MKTLLLGSGGREHALFWKLQQSARVSVLHAWPGNGGFPEDSIPPSLQGKEAAALDLEDPQMLRDFVTREKYELVVVGPEQPLVLGLSDALRDHCAVFGPEKAAARLEGSKDFAKGFMQRHGIPTAASETFTELTRALAYLDQLAPPYVIKADGLAAGKGVVVAADRAEAELALRDRMERRIFGAAGERVLIEEFMDGEEASVFALCDGERALAMQACQDHKRAFDQDQGPNTGGMGAYSPVPLVDAGLMALVQQEVFDRALAGMQAEGSPYRGLLYAGLMIKDGRARVVEFNVRFGDPETQALLPLLDEDLGDLAQRCAQGRLPDRALRFLPGASVVVVVAAQGYPGKYAQDIELKGIDNPSGDIIAFHAGTRRVGSRLLSTGVTAIGQDLVSAREKVYGALKSVRAEGVFYRKDIGEKALKWL